MHQIKIAAFDEEPLFRAGIIHVLNADPRIQVIAEGSSASEVLKLSKELSPDIIILDANLLDEGMSPIAALSSDVKIIILSANKTQVHAALAAGARGYVLKGVSRHEFLDAVWAVHRGDGYVSPALAMDIMDMMLTHAGQARRGRSTNTDPLSQLSYREGQIFKLLSAGLKNKEIGARLALSEKSIKRYVTGIFEKLNVRNRVEAALFANAGSSSIPLLGEKAVSTGLNNDRPIEPATARCFSVVFGRCWTVFQSQSEKSEPANGTHILL